MKIGDAKLLKQVAAFMLVFLWGMAVGLYLDGEPGPTCEQRME